MQKSMVYGKKKINKLVSSGIYTVKLSDVAPTFRIKKIKSTFRYRMISTM
jgi:hypothetical protein